MNNHELQRWLTKYFQESNKLDTATQQKFYQLLDRYSSQKNQLLLIKILFNVMQNSMTRENLKNIVKKYLHLMNIILEKDSNVEEHKQYKNAVSGQIVNHFILILKQLLKNSMIDQILLVKVYRKKWAKRITDSAF